MRHVTSRFRMWKCSILAGVFGGAIAAGPAWAAGTAQTTFTVSATVLTSCSVSATTGTLGFGNYTASSATPADASTDIGVTCSSGLGYTIKLDGGTSAANVVARTMTDGSHTLSYGLYTASNHTTSWGDGTGGTSTVGGTGNAAAQPYTIYGRIPVGQYAAAGSYQDTVTVTVAY